MISRRAFLLVTLASVGGPVLNVAATAKRVQRNSTQLQSAFRLDLPPTLLPDRVKFTAGEYSCLVDDVGKLVIADLHKSTNPRIMGEFSGLGKRLFDFACAGGRGYALVLKRSNSGESQAALSIVNLTKRDVPVLASQLALSEFMLPQKLSVENGYVCISGSSVKEENLVSIYQDNGSRTSVPKLVTSFALEQPVAAMFNDRKDLYLLAGDAKSMIYRVGLTPDAKAPKPIVTLDGKFTTMAARGNLIAVAGKGESGFEVVLVNCLPAPHAVCSQTLADVQNVYSMASVSGSFLLLIERDEHLNLIEMAVDRSLKMTAGECLPITKFAGTPETVTSLEARDRYANVVTGSDSVFVLNRGSSGWAKQSTFTFPQLAYSELVCWGHYLVLGGSDLSLYEVKDVKKTHKILSTEVEGTIKSMAVAGSYLLCQTKSSLSLRKLSQLSEVIVSIKITGQDMSYDAVQEKSYVIDRSNGNTIVTPVRIYSNNLIAGKAFELSPAFANIVSFGSKFLLGGTNDLGLYSFGSAPELVGRRHFPNHAIRAIGSTSEYLLVAAVDQELSGCLMVVSPELSGGELELISNLDLPHDACALAVSANKIVLLGRSPEGHSVLTTVNIDDPSQPKLVSTTNIVSDACGIALRDKSVFVCGRGLEILNL